MATYQDSKGIDQGNYFWWKKKGKGEDALVVLNQAINKLKLNNHQRQRKNRFHWQLYRNQLIRSNSIYEYGKYHFPDQSTETTLSLNVVKPIIDTAIAKISSNKPRPRILTDGGEWRDHEKARKLTKFVDGQLHHSKFYEMAPQALKDAAIFGTGFLKLFNDNNDIVVEKATPLEMLVDDSEALYSEPQTLHQLKRIHKEVLKQMFPGNDLKIDECKNAMRADNEAENSEMIEVRMSWKRAVSTKNRDGSLKIHPGRYVISINTVILENIEYMKDYFPFIIFKWTDLGIGLYGTGITEDIADIQLELNDLLQIAQDSLHLTEVPRIFVEENANVNTQHFDDEVGTIISYRGTAPIVSSGGGTSQVLLAQIENLYRKMFEISGVSQLAAQSKKPAGLDSGVAIREFNDIETERFYNVEKRYETGFTKAAEMMIDMVKDIFESNDKYAVKAPGAEFLETIKWKDVDLSKDRYTMQTYSSSFLPRTPAGKIARVQELAQAGLIPPEQIPNLLDFPDIQAFTNRQAANIRLTNDIIDKMAYNNKYIAPEPFMNLAEAMGIVQRAYLEYKMKNLPEERQALFRRWLEDARILLEPNPDASLMAQNAEAALIDQASAGEALPPELSEPSLNPLA